jgi:hypothetical protein
MNLPRSTFAVFVAGLICLNSGLASCSALKTGEAPSVDSSQPTQAATADSEPTASQFASTETLMLPGPLRPLLRMAGISQDVSRAEVLPLLARNVSLWGYQNNQPTEFLMLIDRYVHLARELQALSGSDGIIRVAGCDDATRLIQVLGYQFQNGCGPAGAVLVTADAERAFLTVDSGFPITTLEDALQKNTPFTYPFPATPVPVLFNAKDWTGLSPVKKKYGNNLIDILLHDKNVDRLYSALARIDGQTNLALFRSPGLSKLLPYAAELDFYGSRIAIRSGKVEVPGGHSAEQAWNELTGASPASPGDFVLHLISRDQGWLAAYFDAMSRISSTQQAHFVQNDRLDNLYLAYRSASRNSPNSAAQGVFTRNSTLLVFLTRLQWQPDGEPPIPGNLQVWKEILSRKSSSNNTRGRPAGLLAPTSAEQFLQALAASSIAESPGNPLQIYLMLSAIDAGKPTENKLSEATVRLLAGKFDQLNAWYPIFAEFPALDDASISAFIDGAEQIGKLQDSTLRSNALGAFQAEVGLWQILARQGQISDRALNQSWQSAIKPFADASSPIKLFDAARASLQSMILAASGNDHPTQDQLIDLLAGPAQDSADGRRAHLELARRIRNVMVDQHLVSLDSLFGLYDGLGEMAHGAKIADNLILLAGDLREFELPRPIFTGSEKTSWAPIVYTARHVELQLRTDLTAIIRNPSSPAQLESARGRLTPFLRDTLVGLNYAYYEPPGAQVLHHNPLFVRSHDFSASSVQGIEDVWDSPGLVGVGVTAGGGTYLLGSLANLPYALASVEQDFIAPANVQALIWKEIVPGFLVDSILPRWWGIRQDEMHAAALYQRAGEELLIASASDPQLRERVLGILADRMAPARLELTAQALRNPQSATLLIPRLLPADTFFLAAGFRGKYPDQASQWGNAGRELNELVSKDPTRISPEHLAKDFGSPHLAIAGSDSPTLLNLEMFPASGAFEGRLFGESWESSNLYWARLADEMGYSPAMLNLLVPNLTRRMVANIFATNIDDWPALLRALHRTGDEFRQNGANGNGAGTMTGQVSEFPIAPASTGSQQKSGQE